MKEFNYQPTLFLITGIALFLFACNSSYAGNSSLASTSVVKAALEKAHNTGQAAFVVVTGNGIAGTEKAVAIAEKARTIYKKAVLVQMNRDDAANADLVNEWRLSGAPLPLILVISPGGVLTGGQLLAQATAESIAALVPSPKKEKVLEQLVTGKSVFILVSSKSMAKKNSQLSTCMKACMEMKENAKVVEIDLNDPLEASFLNELRINRNISEPTTYVINSSGQVTDTFNGEVSSTALVASAKKVIASSCCPAGSGKTCPPAK